jgi:hypothetical protein
MSDSAQSTEKKEETVVCYISKRTVPVSQTVEVAYGASKKYRVLSKYAPR